MIEIHCKFIWVRCHYGLLRNAWTGAELQSAAKQQLDLLLKKRRAEFMAITQRWWEERAKPWMAHEVKRSFFFSS